MWILQYNIFFCLIFTCGSMFSSIIQQYHTQSSEIFWFPLRLGAQNFLQTCLILQQIKELQGDSCWLWELSILFKSERKFYHFAQNHLNSHRPIFGTPIFFGAPSNHLMCPNSAIKCNIYMRVDKCYDKCNGSSTYLTHKICSIQLIDLT